MKISHLTSIGFRLNHAIDKGLHKDISIEIIKEIITDKSLPEYLEKKLGCDVFEALTPTELNQLLEVWGAIIDCYTAGDLNVSENGICLLLALVLDTIQSDELLPLRE